MIRTVAGLALAFVFTPGCAPTPGAAEHSLRDRPWSDTGTPVTGAAVERVTRHERKRVAP